MKTLMAAALALAWPALALGGPKYYIELNPTEEAAGLKTGLLDEAKQILSEELKKRPDVVLHADGAPHPSEADLKQKGLRGVSMVVRIEALSDEVLPPEGGKGARQLQASARTSVLGTAIPSRQMVLAGDGECTLGTKVTATKIDERERKHLRLDALKDALHQSVEKAFSKLGEKPEGAKGKKKKKKKA